MTKDPAPKAAKKTGLRGETEASLKSQLERLDRDLVKLINQRAKLASHLAKLNHSGAGHPPEPEPEAIVTELSRKSQVPSPLGSGPAKLIPLTTPGAARGVAVTVADAVHPCPL